VLNIWCFNSKIQKTFCKAFLISRITNNLVVCIIGRNNRIKLRKKEKQNKTCVLKQVA